MKILFPLHLGIGLTALTFSTQLSSPLVAQTKNEQIVGTVTDDKGEPLVGVNISLEGTKHGVTSNLDGQFSINAPMGATLKFSFIGMKNKSVRITKRKLKVILSEDAKALDQVVVTGYQKIRNRVYTGSATSLKLQEVKLEGIGDVSRMLEGRVPGLSIQNISGSFGSAPRINIRGGASIIGNVQPLWVIDGAVYESLVSLNLDELASGDAVTLISSAIAGLNPSDIEDIQVLKDASATSIYGARALNGVIVVTTKSGRRNTKNSISYSAELSFREKPRYQNFDLLNSQQTMAIYKEMENKGYFDLKTMLYGRRGGAYHQLYSAINTINPETGDFYLPNTPEAKKAFLQEREYANTDWFDLLFTNKPIHSHTISFSGGGKNSSLYASLGLYQDLGWTLTDNTRRFTANLKNTFYWSERFRSTLSAQANMRKQQAPGTIPQKKNNRVGTFEREFDINPFSYALGTSRTLRPYDKEGRREYYRNNWADFNILDEYENNLMTTDVLDFKAQADLNFNVNKYLELRGLLSFRQATTSTSHEIHEGSNVVKAYRAAESPEVLRDNVYLYRDLLNPLAQPEVALLHGGILNKTETSLKNYMARLAVEYNRQFGEHDLKLFGFTELRHTERSINPFQGYGIRYDKGNQIFPTPLIFSRLAQENSDYFNLTHLRERGITFSTNATYGYKGKYIFNTVVNYEGANTAGLGGAGRWLPTWNVGFKWNADKEAFLSKHSSISRLALRMSYGLTAKMNEEAINSNVVYKNVLTNRPRLEDRENKLEILHLANKDLTWEKMYEGNLGLEMGFFNNRIMATLDLYQRNSFDLIDLIRTSGVGGQYYKYANFGDMRTQGVELMLTSKNFVGEFNWTSTLTLGMMNQKITRLLNNPNTLDMVSGTGRGNILGFPRGSLFSFNHQGLSAEGLPTFDFGLYPISSSPIARSAGVDFLDSQYSKSYLIYHGPIEPQITGGLANSFSYKGFELSFFVTMQAGNKIRLNPSFDPLFADLNVFSKDYYNRWLNPGEELVTHVPTLPSKELIELYGRENIERAYNTYNYSQMRVADGSFVRLKNISLGYTLPASWSKKLGLKTVNLKLNVTNPWLIYADSKLKGQDPEYYRSGGVSLPTPKQYTVTLNIQY